MRRPCTAATPLRPYVVDATGGRTITRKIGPRPHKQLTSINRLHLVAISALLVLTPLIFRTRDYLDKSIDLQVVMKLVVWLFCAVLLASSKENTKLVQSPQGWIWLLWCLSIVATLPFSISPMMSASYEFSTIVCILYPFVAISCLGEIIAVRRIIVVSGLFCAASLFVYIFVPSIGRITDWTYGIEEVSSRMGGLAGHPDAMGHVAGYSALCTILYFDEVTKKIRRHFVICLLVVSIVCLLITDNRTAMFGLIVSGTLWYIIRGGHLARFLLLFLLLAAIIGFAFVDLDSIAALISRSGATIELASMAGRTPIWSIAWEMSLQQFWTGWGYGASVLILPQQMSGILGPLASTAPHAHNMFLQLFFSCGIVPLLLGIMAIAATMVESFITRHYRALCLMTFLVVVGMTESTPFLGIASYDTIMLGVIVGIVARNGVLRRGGAAVTSD